VDINTTKVSEAVHAFTKIVSKEYGDGENTGTVGYILGGWDPDTHIPECYHFVFKPSAEPSIVPLAIGEAKFFGCPEFFTRVFHGYDSRLPNNILRELKKLKFNPAEGSLDQAFAEAFKNAAAPLAAVGFGDLPIREAIDYVHTYLHITIKAFKFRFGPPICGGPIEIAFVSSDRNFRWVCHKSFERAIYEQEVQDD